MTSVWKRLQRVGKKASKFQFVASYQELVLECTKKWQPDKLRVVWTRRNRRMCSKLHSWQPGIKNPYRGMVVWPVPENIDISVTLFKEVNADEFEDKEWTFVIEGENKGHRKVLASADINLKRFASPTPTQTDLTLKLKPLSVKVVDATLKLSLSCVFVREGKATDEDMQSLASLMSVKPTDIGNLDDFNESDEDEDKKSVTATGSAFPLTQVDKETTPSRDEGSRNNRTVANIRVSNQPIKPAQDPKSTVTENKAAKIRSHKEDAADVETPMSKTAKDPEMRHIVPAPAEPSAPALKEEPKEPERPSVELKTSAEVSPVPAIERTALALEPLLPSKPEPGLRPEQVLQPSGKPQQEGADEEKPSDEVAGGQESFPNNKEPVCREAEKQLWATVEETTTETDREVESNESPEDKDEKQQEEEEEGVIGGPGHPSLAVTQMPSSLPSSRQTLYQSSTASQPNKPEPSPAGLADHHHPKPPSGSKQEGELSLGAQKTLTKEQRDDEFTKPARSLEAAANDEAELVQSSVVPWPLPLSTNTASIHSHTKIHTDMGVTEINNGTEMDKIPTESHKSLEMRDEDTNLGDSPHTQTHTSDLNHPTKEQQLEEEERMLLAKISLMTGDTSPVSGPRGMKRLIPDPCDIDSDHTELVDPSQSFTPCFDNLQEISLTEAADEPPRKNQGEDDV